MPFLRFLAITLFLFGITLRWDIHPSLSQEQKNSHTEDTLFTFRNDVSPLLLANCNPCHFSGGKVYGKLPFDNVKTVASLGKKLNTRLKQKEQQAIITGWIKDGARDSSK